MLSNTNYGATSSQSTLHANLLANQSPYGPQASLVASQSAPSYGLSSSPTSAYSPPGPLTHHSYHSSSSIDHLSSSTSPVSPSSALYHHQSRPSCAMASDGSWAFSGSCVNSVYDYGSGAALFGPHGYLTTNSSPSSSSTFYSPK